VVAAKAILSLLQGLLVPPDTGLLLSQSSDIVLKIKVQAKIKECQRINAPTSDTDNLNKVLIKVLQKSIISDKQPHGLANAKENWFYVPKSGHEDYFDIGCQWFFVPVMTLNEALWGWKSGQPHKVMVLAGDLRISESDYSAQLYKSLIHNKVLDNENSCILKRSEIEKGCHVSSRFCEGSR